MKRYWACITSHPNLPDPSVQEAGVRAWAEDGRDVTLVRDDLSGVRTTNPAARMVERTGMIREMAAISGVTHEVFFRSALCVGIGDRHLEETVKAVWAAGGRVHVQTMSVILVPGDPLDALCQLAKRERDAARARRSRCSRGTEKSDG